MGTQLQATGHASCSFQELNSRSQVYHDPILPSLSHSQMNIKMNIWTQNELK